MIELFLVLAQTGADPVIRLETGRAHQTLEDRLEARLTALREAETPASADMIADEVLSLWRQQAGPVADLLLKRAEDARERGDRDTARRALNHLHLLEPEFSEGWVAAARLAAEAEDWSFALEALNAAVEHEPRRFDAWVMLGQALERAGARTAALEAYEEALAVHPHHARAGQAHARLSRDLAGRAL
ncbi:MAG: tetratricopeptide repeat protein [Oceanicaulis sp.]|nr:tetratricopeptide repeat protein [Oceanicaulis sp.]